MNIIDSIVNDLKSLPTRKLVEVAGYVHRMSESAHLERSRILRETHGCLDDADGEVFEAALASSRRVESHG